MNRDIYVWPHLPWVKLKRQRVSILKVITGEHLAGLKTKQSTPVHKLICILHLCYVNIC